MLIQVRMPNGRQWSGLQGEVALGRQDVEGMTAEEIGTALLAFCAWGEVVSDYELFKGEYLPDLRFDSLAEFEGFAKGLRRLQQAEIERHNQTAATRASARPKGQNWARTFVEIGRRDGFRCRRCGGADDLQLDHVNPISKGGTNDPDNLQLLCASCNLRKSARAPG